MRLIWTVLLCATLTGCPGEPKPPSKSPKKAVPDPSAKGVAAVVGSVNKTKLKACLLAVQNAAKMHKAETGKVPDVKTLIKLELITTEQGTDLWGNPYRIEAKGPRIDVLTYGADGKPGGSGPNTDWSTKDLR